MAKKIVNRSKQKVRRSPRCARMKDAGDTKPQKWSPRHAKQRSLTQSPTTTMDIINTLAQNFLKVDKDISFKKAKSSRSSYGKECLNLSLGPNTSLRYSNNSSFNSTSPKSVDFYDFVEDEASVRLQLDLSPIKGEKTPANSKRKPSKTSSGSRRGAEKENKRSTQSNVASKRKVSDSQTSSKRKRLNTQETVSVKNVKNRKTQSQSNVKKPCSSSVIKASEGKKTTPHSVSVSRDKNSPCLSVCASQDQDSGVFMTPAAVCSSPAPPQDAPCSTPADTPADPKPPKQAGSRRPLRLRNPRSEHAAPGLPDSPMLSPVQKIGRPSTDIQGALITSQSELFEELELSAVVPSPSKPEAVYVDVDTSVIATQEESEETEDDIYKTLNISKTYSGLGFGYFDRPVEEKKKKKKTTRKPERVSISRYDVVADKMNQEFDDLDNFEFSLD